MYGLTSPYNFSYNSFLTSLITSETIWTAYSVGMNKLNK